MTITTFLSRLRAPIIAPMLAPIRAVSRSSILSGLLAYGASEIAVRLVRLGVVIIIARQLVPELVGVAALALTLFELIRILVQIGVGQKIIAASEADLPALCNGAHRLLWGWCLGVAGVQTMVGFIMIHGFDQPLVGQMLWALSGVYLFMPGGLIQCFLLMRARRMTTTARIAAQQTIADHLLTAALLLVWPSAWAIALPKLLTAPIWLIGMRRAMPWQPQREAGYAPLSALLGFGLSVLATEALMALRTQADKLLVGALLGVGALGTYFFAYNAGIGIVSALLSAFSTVIYPHICQAAAANRIALVQRLALIGSISLGLLITGQIALAPFYVPLIFGSNWVHATPLIMLLALAAVPIFASTLLTAWLRSADRPDRDAMIGLLASFAALSGLAIGSGFGLLAAAGGWVLGLMLIFMPAALLHLRARSMTPMLSSPSSGELV